MNKYWIQTFTGRKFYPLEPDPAQFDIRDIAHALSMICRYVGHTSRFYSVAEHSVRVSRRVEELLVDAPSEARIEGAKWGLIHDASEAYLGDMARPIKIQPTMAPYRDAEKRLQAGIAAWLGMSLVSPRSVALVSQVDEEILGTEARQLKQPLHPEWSLAPDIPGLVLGWDPETAERVFLRRFKRFFERSA